MDAAGRGAMGVEMIGAEFTLGGLGVFLAVWTVMMGAMMLPSAARMILTFAAAQARRDRNVAVPTWMFAAAYIFVWAYAGLVVYVLLHAGKDLLDNLAWLEHGAWPLALGVTCGAVSIHASQAALSPPLPLALGLSEEALARRRGGRGRNGILAGPLLFRLLLGTLQCDGCCCRDDEHRLDACDDDGCIRRKSVAAQSPYLSRGGSRVDRSGAAGRERRRPARRLHDAA